MAENIPAQESIVYQDRRYVGTKETMAYLLFDASQEFNINAYEDRFIFDVLKIDLDKLSIIKAINSVWDIINDVFSGILVDKTRTRWGKFKPYLIALAIPGTILTTLFWATPIFFDDDPNNKAKFFVWLMLAICQEGVGTFQGIAKTGLLATITPHPVDRTRLMMKNQLIGGLFGSQIPEILMGLLIDLVNHKVITAFSLKGTFVTMGLFTSVVAGLVSLYAFINMRERVVQSVDRPSLMEGIRSIINNKPILLYTMAEFLGAFSLNAGINNYYIDVLGSASIKNIVGIPGGFFATASYAYVPWARRKFSTKTLWIVGSMWGEFLMGLVFFVGSIGGRGPEGWYRQPSKMIPTIMAQETIWMTVFGIRRIIPQEMLNEAMDYCEWKNGYRTEGMTSIARGLASKLVKNVSTSIRPALMKMFGYDLKAGFGEQSDRTKYALFALCTIIPFVTSLLSIIPKLMYDLTGRKRELMYEELLVRREAKQKELSTQHALVQEDVQS